MLTAKYPLTEVDFVNLTYMLTTQEQTRHARNLLFSQPYGEDITVRMSPTVGSGREGPFLVVS